MTSTAEPLSPPDRFVRQSDLVPAEALREKAVTVVGVGAVGRPLAMLLVAMGVRQLQLVDPDSVEIHNVSSQGYSLGDVGRPKVEALAAAALAFDPSVELKTVRDVYRHRYPAGDAAFCCVDSIATRAVLWKGLASRVRFWADGRMLGETLRVLAATDEASRRHYPTTLFAQAEAQVGRCTARSTLYVASVCAGLLAHQFTRWLRGIAVDKDVTLNLLAGEWMSYA